MIIFLFPKSRAN